MLRLVFGVVRALVVVLVVGVLAIPIVCTITHTKPYIVAGASMQPTYRLRDVVYVKAAEQYRVGDVVQVTTDNPFVHRIVAVLPDGRFRTCGDANCPNPAEWESGVDTEPVVSNQITGKVVLHVGEPWARIVRIGATWPGRVFGAIVCVLLLWPWTDRKRRA
ncbi:MAG: S24/S26 family peptidase [Bifidobacteriaceae bacterium]|nr:S24/S26 family peptidase [Bifidobacteriaceae bacterium]